MNEFFLDIHLNEDENGFHDVVLVRLREHLTASHLCGELVVMVVEQLPQPMTKTLHDLKRKLNIH